MTENKVDERRLMAAGFMLYGAIASLIVALYLLYPRFEGLAPVGSLPFLMAAACYLGFAIMLRRGNKQPVVNLKQFAWGNSLLFVSVQVFLRNYGEYIGYYGDDPGSYSKIFLMVIAAVVFINAIVMMWGKKETEEVDSSGEDK